MQHATSADADPLAEFERRNDPAGLLRRYARGRVMYFGSRQILTVSGGILLMLMNSPLSGLAAMVLALTGDAVDCLYLRGLPRRLAAGHAFTRIYAVSTLTAAVQAIAISACVALAWFGMTTSASPLFAVAFLSGAAINGGLVLPYHRAAGIARLVIYGAVGVGLFTLTGVLRGPPDALFSMNAAGSLMLGYMVFSFLDYVASGFRRNQASTRALIETGNQLQAVNRELTARQKEAQRLSLVARNANDGVVLSDADGRIVWVNEAFTRITGYTTEEAVGRTPGALLNGPDTDPRTVAALADSTALGVPFRCEIQNRTKDGSQVWIETNQVPVLDEHGAVEMTVAIDRDVTQAKRHERELEQARQAAEEGARAKAEFLATMSHEIRTPMNGVIGMADLLLESQLTEDQRLYGDTIRSSALALLAVINDVLDLSKLDARKMVLDPVEFDLCACLQDTIRLLHAQARDKGLELNMIIEGDVPEHVRGDDGRLRQILINLIGNALKFTQQGGVTVRARGKRRGDVVFLEVDVEDTGIGIPEDKLELIFERFSQADASTTRQFGGTGLGLTISRLLTEAMGGDIRVTSEPGAGSCFSVSLVFPVVAGSEAGRRRRQQMPDPERLALLAGRNVLAAEDNQVNRVLIRKYLRNLGLQLDFAHDGLEAVEKALKDRPDIVLMDMSMPGLNGIEAAHRIRASAGKQPVIIALTANAFENDRKACLDAGMDGFLTKPVRRAELVSCMLDMLDQCRDRSGTAAL